MKNKAFTLVELITVIALLAVISLIIFPIIINKIDKGKENAYNIQINSIKKATENFALKNISSIPQNSGDTLTLNLSDLKTSNLIDMDIINPITNKPFPNDMLITITKMENQYNIEVIEDSGTDIFVDEEVLTYSPIVVLYGPYLEYVELNSTYNDLGAYAKTYEGVNISSSIVKEIYKELEQKSNVDTSVIGAYKIYYLITDPNNNYKNRAIRTVIVRDTTPPVINLEDVTTINLNEASTFDLMNGVSATDNSLQNVNITYEGSINNKVGEYIITYKATDIYNNISTKKRIIKVI